MFLKVSLQLKMILFLMAIFAFSCVKKPPLSFLAHSYIPSGPAAIFQDDFPFFVSPKTPDLNTVIFPARPGCSVKLLGDGPENFALRAEIMKNARSYIELQTYIFADDATGRDTARIFKEKITAGLEVRLIVDAYNKFSDQDRDFYEKLEKFGLQIAGFEPLSFTFLNDNYLPTLREFNMRYHEKYLMVDDYIGIVGGTNIADEYAGLGTEPEKQMRDQDVLLTGPVVKDLRIAFKENFNEFKEREQSRPAWLKKARSRGPRNVPGETEGLKFNPVELPFKIENFADPEAMVRLIRSRPRYEETYIYQTYLFLIKSARKSILIENSYFIPDQELNQAILDAARRGVEIVMIIECGKPKDPYQMQPAITRHYYLPLMEAGVKIYEWQLMAKGQEALHSKFAVFDGQVSIIGSYNLDPRCKLLNSENVVLINSEKTAQALIDYVHTKDLGRTEPVSLENAQKWRYPRDLKNSVKLLCALLIKDYW